MEGSLTNVNFNHIKGDDDKISYYSLGDNYLGYNEIPADIPEKKVRNKNLLFEWKNINLKINTKTEEKIIIQNSCGNLFSGEVLAIIGQSGAGKTTFMNYLSGKFKSDNIKSEGEILINKINIEKSSRKNLISYIMQDDILNPYLTPLEILMFTAKIKLNCSREKAERKVMEIIKNLNLENCQNTRIGNEIKRGVSGGERKRVSIAVDLILDPIILLIDEPTTCLDSFNASEVLRILKNFAVSQGKIIIYSIHQAASEYINFIDKLFILSLGRTVYFGGIQDSFKMFELNNLPVPKNYNPFEFFIEMTSSSFLDEPKILEFYPEIEKNFDENMVHEKYKYFIDRISDNYLKHKSEFDDENEIKNITIFKDLNQEKVIKKSWFSEFNLNLARGLIISLRDPKFLRTKLIQYILCSILSAALYYNLRLSLSGIHDRDALFFCLSYFTINLEIISSIFIFYDEKKMLRRERNSRLYRLSSYYVARVVLTIPIIFISCSLFAIINYYILRLNEIYSYKLFVYILILIMGNLLGSLQGFFFGVLGDSKESMNALNAIISTPLLFITGFVANASNFAPYLYPFYYISPFKIIYELLFYNEFESGLSIYCINWNRIECDLLNVKSFQTSYTLDYVSAGLLFLCLHVIVFLILKRRVSTK